MTNHFHKIATYTALILTSSLPLSFDVLADAEKKQTTQAVVASADKTPAFSKHKLLAEKNQQVIVEARDALNGTRQALIALEKNDGKTALALLNEVSQKLATVQAQTPAPIMVTAEVETDIYDFDGDAKSVAKELKQADDFLDSGKLQNARQILSGLASEAQITTVNIPLDTFPAAIKDAQALVKAGKTAEAALALDQVLNTLIEITEVIPLPVLRAEALLTMASELEHRDDLHKEQAQVDILKYTDAAKEKLKFAELLGYGGKDDYKQLYDAIDEIKDVVHSKSASTVWEKIKQGLTDLKSKISVPKK